VEPYFEASFEYFAGTPKILQKKRPDTGKIPHQDGHSFDPRKETITVFGSPKQRCSGDTIQYYHYL
jgi:hypothetical protein